MERPCNPDRCRICRPGRHCAATHAWLEAERYGDTHPSPPPPDPDAPTLRERLAAHTPSEYRDRWGALHPRDDAYKAGRPVR